MLTLAASCMSAAPTRVTVDVNPPKTPRPTGFDMGSVNAYCLSLGTFSSCGVGSVFGSLFDPLCDYSCFAHLEGSPNFDTLVAGFCSKGGLQHLNTPIICASGYAAFERSGDSSVRVLQCDTVCTNMLKANLPKAPSWDPVHKAPIPARSSRTTTTAPRKPTVITTSSHAEIPDTPRTTTSQKTLITVCILSAVATLLCVGVGVGAKRLASRSGQAVTPATKRRQTQAFVLSSMPRRPAPTYGHLVGDEGDDVVLLPQLSVQTVLDEISSNESDYFTSSSPGSSPSSNGGHSDMASSAVSANAEPVEWTLGCTHPSVSDASYVASKQACVLPFPTLTPSPAGSVGQDGGRQSTVRSPYHAQPFVEQQQSPVRSPYHCKPHLEHPSPVRSLHHFQRYLEHPEQPSLFDERQRTSRYDCKHQNQQGGHCPDEHYHEHQDQLRHEHQHQLPSHQHFAENVYPHQYPQQRGNPSYAILSPPRGNIMLFQPAPSNDAHILEPVRIPSQMFSAALAQPTATVGTNVRPYHTIPHRVTPLALPGPEEPFQGQTRSKRRDELQHTRTRSETVATQPVPASSAPQKLNGNGHSLGADLAHDHLVSSRYDSSSLGLVSNPPTPHVVSDLSLGVVVNPTRPPHMLVARTAHGWEPWVYELTAKQRNLCIKDMNLSREEANSLKAESRRRKQRKSQAEYVYECCLLVCCQPPHVS